MGHGAALELRRGRVRGQWNERAGSGTGIARKAHGQYVTLELDVLRQNIICPYIISINILICMFDNKGRPPNRMEKMRSQLLQQQLWCEHWWDRAASA